MNTNKIFVSRDVIFHEKHFPYHHNPTTSSSSHKPLQFFLPADTQSHFFYDPFSDISSSLNTSPTSILSSTSTDSSTSSNTIDYNSSNPAQSDPIAVVPLRVSNRVSQPPSYLKDYICSNVNRSNPTTEHWCNLVSSNAFHNIHTSFNDIHKHLVEPTSYKQASKDPRWISAMNTELAALKANDTWSVVDLPLGKKPIGSKWVYKIKLKANGSVERFKARLVAKGYTQTHGVDYDETFSPVVKITTIRALLAVAVQKKWELHQLDVNNAFLHGDLYEEVYMKLPDGIPNPGNKVCKLQKSLYGLKQASRQWFAKLHNELVLHGFKQSKNDYSVFVKNQGITITIAAIYVDDIILTGNDSTVISNLKTHLHNVFSIKDLGRLHYFLGLEVSYVHDGIILSQHKFAKDLLATAGLSSYKSTVTPLPLNLQLSCIEGTLLLDATYYRSMVGKLNFLTHTRPDLAYSVQHLSQFMQQPREPHLQALHHTVSYVAHTVGQGILLKGSDKLVLQAFSDSDWASCIDSRKSVSGYVLQLGQSPISWK